MLEQNTYGYHFNTFDVECHITTYVDDISLLIDDIKNMQPQVDKLQLFEDLASINTNLSKCALIGCPNKSHLPRISSKPTSKHLASRTKATYSPYYHKSNYIHLYVFNYYHPKMASIELSHFPKNRNPMSPNIITTGYNYPKKKTQHCYSPKNCICIPCYSFLQTQHHTTRQNPHLHHKAICQIPNNSRDILVQLPHEDFGMNTISPF